YCQCRRPVKPLGSGGHRNASPERHRRHTSSTSSADNAVRPTRTTPLPPCTQGFTRYCADPVETAPLLVRAAIRHTSTTDEGPPRTRTAPPRLGRAAHPHG